MMDIIFSVIVNSFFDGHTYIGIALGALFAPFWVAIYNYLTGLLIKAEPSAAVVVNDVKIVTDDVVAVITPEVNAITTDITQPKA
jgi:hypothetical protein